MTIFNTFQKGGGGAGGKTHSIRNQATVASLSTEDPKTDIFFNLFSYKKYFNCEKYTDS
jgi:hypothetical protein